MVTDAAPVYPGVLDELVPAAWHHLERYANNPDRVRRQPPQTPAESLHRICTDRTAQIIITGLAFVQNLRREHHELATETPHELRVAAAFTDRAQAI